mmetsp:Transcript_13511/g.21114  ORF Transcript_13511/g.21114 Transcript_13511/m.21114 type:complete len:282 (+) Transcript_13511:602-1447(+)
MSVAPKPLQFLNLVDNQPISPQAVRPVSPSDEPIVHQTPQDSLFLKPTNPKSFCFPWQLTVKGKEVKILQEFNEKRKNGMAIYEGNLVLSNYLQSLPESYWKGKKVLELGCGTGFGSVTASLCGAESVTASDRDPNVLNLAKKNLVRNLGDQGSFKTARVAWGTPQCTSENTKMDVEINACWEQEVRGSGYDLVIGADLTYTAELIPKIIETIKLFGSPKAEVVFCWCEPDLFNWNTDVMDQLNQGIKLFDKEFKVESIKSGPIVEGHPNTFLLHMRAKQA